MQLTPNWYTGRRTVHSLVFEKCHVSRIRTRAFAGAHTANISQLLFANFKRGLTLDFGAFDGLNKLWALQFTDCCLIDITYRIMESVTHVIQFFTYSMCKSVLVNTTDLIGGIKMPFCMKIHFESLRLTYKIITSNTLTHVPSLSSLSLIDCGIEVITLGAFDHLPRTMHTIDLRKNLLKTIPSTLFDKLPNAIIRDYLFINNPWQCTCDILTLQKKYEANFGFVCRDYEPQLHCPVSSDRKDISWREKRVCSTHYGTNVMRIRYPSKYRINLNNDNGDGWSYYIKADGQQYSVSYLLRITSDPKYHLCLRLRNTKAPYDAIRNTGFNNIGIHTICIIDDPASEHIWPLNCISYTIHTVVGTWISQEWKSCVIICSSAVYLLAFLTTVILGIELVKKRPILLKGSNRIYFSRNAESNAIKVVLVLPSDCEQRQLDTIVEEFEETERAAEAADLQMNYDLAIIDLNHGQLIEQNYYVEDDSIEYGGAMMEERSHQRVYYEPPESAYEIVDFVSADRAKK